jgi:hypothetical protein
MIEFPDKDEQVEEDGPYLYESVDLERLLEVLRGVNPGADVVVEGLVAWKK